VWATSLRASLLQCNGRGRGRVRLQVGKATKFIFGRGWIEGGIRGVLP
jgi:hypothetical protein